MYKKILFLIFFMINMTVRAQIIYNKTDIGFGFGIGKFGGEMIGNDDGFISPSLYPNYKNLNTISFRGIFIKKKYLDFGVSFSYSQVSGWETDLYSDYLNSGVTKYSFYPMVRIHNPMNEYGLLNRFKFFIETGPVSGFANLSLSNPLFDIQNSGSLVDQPDGSNDFFYGLKGSAGIEVSVNQWMGVFVAYSYGYSFISSAFYSDNHFSYNAVEAGFCLKLMKDKRYFY